MYRVTGPADGPGQFFQNCVMAAPNFRQFDSTMADHMRCGFFGEVLPPCTSGISCQEQKFKVYRVEVGLVVGCDEAASIP
jgi:hypothetical protein